MTSLNATQQNINQYNDFSPDFLVDEVIALEKRELEEFSDDSSDGFLDDFPNPFTTDWDKVRSRYLKYEHYIRTNPENAVPTWQVADPLHYGMSLSRMEEVIQQKFQEMVLSGQIVREDTLLENKKRNHFYPPKGYQRTNLTRIWGADFLKSEFSENSTLDAAKHYLVVDKGATEIFVKVFHGNDRYPILSTVENANVLSDKIEGIRAAWGYRFDETLSRVRYRDFKDDGNIIRDENDIGWVVDTEYKSFDAPKLRPVEYRFNYYLKKRFKVISGDQYHPLQQTFQVSLSDIGLT